MAYPDPFLRLVVAGTLYGNERFAWGLSLMPNFSDPLEDYPTEVPAGVITALSTFHNTANITTSCAMDLIKLNLIGTDGRYVNNDTVLHEFETPVTGTGSTAFPPQVSLAVTLLGSRSRGPGSRGRFYIPGPALVIQGDGRITSSAALNIANMAANMIQDINEALPLWRVANMSNVGAGVKSMISGVSVGRVYDTIRSRRRSLDEDRQVSTVDPNPT